MKILLDAGHGPNTPGKRSPDGMREYEFNSAVADAMKSELLKYEGVTVYFAHDDKRDVPLSERTNKANKLCVDVYVSLHANAAAGRMGSHGGIETFAHSSKPKEACEIAKAMQTALIKATGLRDRGVKYADFYVLGKTAMTAVLIEHGFMDSTTDLPKLKDAGFRKLCGVTNAKSLAAFYGLKRKPEPKPEPTQVPGADNHVHRVIVDGKQVGAFGKAEGVAITVEKAVKAGAKQIKIERV